MDSASISFIFFGVLIAWFMSWSSSERWRTGLLVVASMLFLHLVGATLRNALPMIGFLALGFVGMWFTSRSRAFVPIFVVASVLAFMYLKKYTFFPQASLMSHMYFTLGLSYILFRVLHLLIESREMSPGDRPGLLHYLAYTVNFTTLVSGPIQRYAEFKSCLPLSPLTSLDADTIVSQLARVARGYFKVNVIASLLDIAHMSALVALGQPSAPNEQFLPALVLIIVYPFFLYANFSGYIDIIIGLARLMRIRLPENFDRPFSASSFLDFWSRWHITLSQWLKFYVYNPLLIFLMRRVTSVAIQPYLGVLCFFVTFFLVGVWHGRTSEFAVFGLLQGGGVATNKLWQIFLGKRLGKKRYKAFATNIWYLAFGRGLTFGWFAFTMFWFWADWRQIGMVFHSLPAPAWALAWLLVIAMAALCLTACLELRQRFFVALPASGGAWVSFAKPILFGAVLFSSFFYCALLDQPAPGIVYKAF